MYFSTDMEPLPIVFDIIKTHSADPEREDLNRFFYSQLKPGWFVDMSPFPGGKIQVECLSEEAITVSFFKETIMLTPGEDWTSGPVKIYNPIDSDDEATITIRFHRLSFWEYVTWLMDRIIPIHEKSHHSLILSTTDDEQMVLSLINQAIDDGEVGLYPFKALLMASNNWHTTKILRIGMFKEILLEGIEKGALGSDDSQGWEWLHVAADTNDPSEFMTDMERYYDLLASAAENGNTDALDIMNEIWPPEQIIEED